MFIFIFIWCSNFVAPQVCSVAVKNFGQGRGEQDLESDEAQKAAAEFMQALAERYARDELQPSDLYNARNDELKHIQAKPRAPSTKPKASPTKPRAPPTQPKQKAPATKLKAPPTKPKAPFDEAEGPTDEAEAACTIPAFVI